MNDTSHFDYLNRQSEYGWEKVVHTPLGKLQLAAARLARIELERDPELKSERIEALKDRCGQWLREADPEAVLGDYQVSKFILRLWNRWPRRLP